MTKYEQLIEYIINEDEAKARELFHQIVVEKSREIYESMMDEEEDLDEVVGGDQVEAMVDEITMDEEGMQEAEEDDSEEDDSEEEDEGFDDMELDADEELGDEEDAPATKQDLEDFKDDIEATFRQIMSQEFGDEDMGDDMEADMDMDAEMDAEMGMDDMGAEGDEDLEAEGMYMEAKAAKKEEMLAKKGDKSKRKMTEAEWLREYVDKIGDVYGQEPAQGEGNEVGAGKKAKVSAQSIVAGKNDMGGTAKNLNQGEKGEDPDGKQTPQPNNEYTKGRGNLPHAGKFQNVPGAKTKPVDSGKPEYSKAHGAEGQTTGGKLAVSVKSPVAK